MHLKKGNNQTFRDYRHFLWTDISPKGPKTLLWSTSQGRGSWRSDDQCMFSSNPVGPVHTQTNVVIISPGSTMEIDILISWQNPHTCFLTFRVRAIKAWKTKWEPLELLLSRKIVPPKQYHIPEVIAEISATIKTKDAGCFFSPNPIWCTHLACTEGSNNLELGEWQWIIISLTRWLLQL